jgi:hypothetical protein
MTAKLRLKRVASERLRVPARGEVWRVATVGVPGVVLVLSHVEFNRANGSALVAVIDCDAVGAPSAGFGVSFLLGVVRVNDVRMLDLITLKGRFVESVPAAVLSDVLARFRVIFE